MITRIYRRKPLVPRGFRVSHESVSAEEAALGYLDFDHTSRCATRYTRTGTLINVTEPWHESLEEWARTYAEFWTFDPAQSYFAVDPDLQMDEGL